MYSKKHASFFYVKSDLKNIVQNAIHTTYLIRSGPYFSESVFRLVIGGPKAGKPIRV